ncbi:MAG: hypothetical protein WBL74_11070 [Novosphingobium sp.]|uniref:hypothetical protein n=1 Tax=Novosphingobium sp. TaxID=1874826 RepID=UPI003C7EC416
MQVEVYLNDADDAPRWTLEFAAIPRVGEYVALDAGGLAMYYDVVEVWYRQVATGSMQACIGVKLDD